MNAQGTHAWGRWTPLHWAVLSRQKDMVSFLTAQGADISVTDNHDVTPLDLALKQRGHTECLEALITNCPNVNLRYRQMTTLLHVVVAENSPKLVSLLLAKGADVDAKDFQENNPLVSAVANTNSPESTKEIVQLLLNQKADPQQKAVYAATALPIAAKAGRSQILEMLLGAGADINARDKDGVPPLVFAAAGQESIVRLLLDKGAKVNNPDNEGRTALHVAASTGNLPVAKLLIEKGADVNSQDRSGQTPLQLATVAKQAAVIALLVDKGADMDIFSACRLGKIDKVKQLLGANPSLVEIKDGEGRTPLSLAAAADQKAVTDLLIDKGAVMDIFVASRLGRLDRVKEIAEMTPPLVNSRDMDGRIPLSLAVLGCHKDVAECYTHSASILPPLECSHLFSQG